ncbi:hypothetical protein [Poseidonibacter ostreae]|uniref:Uncharacterized protein n=1 Tax=Poseidonibacter ostreae TaxID=2654171 RepID=A0A6L4WWA4_9BACT|nr:hypothetical protein [Poseidonibacter ostreae]KAB7891316.1 hypothetical protein GBG19_00335 [Poseidonibacter ostreae]
MKFNSKNKLGLALIASLLMLQTMAFGASGVENVFTNMESYLGSISKLIPMLIKILLMLFTVTCIFVMPLVAYMLAFRHFKKQDEKNDSDTSATMTVAKASGMAILGFLGGILLFSFVTISGMGLDTAITSGSGDGIGKVVLALLSLSYP